MLLTQLSKVQILLPVKFLLPIQKHISLRACRSEVQSQFTWRKNANIISRYWNVICNIGTSFQSFMDVPGLATLQSSTST